MTAQLKVARAAGNKIRDAKMTAAGRLSEIRDIYKDAQQKRKLLDPAELNQIVMLDVQAFREIETILDTIEAVTD